MIFEKQSSELYSDYPFVFHINGAYTNYSECSSGKENNLIGGFKAF